MLCQLVFVPFLGPRVHCLQILYIWKYLISAQWSTQHIVINSQSSLPIPNVKEERSRSGCPRHCRSGHNLGGGMENYKKALRPFSVIGANQNKRYFNFCCISESHPFHHFTRVFSCIAQCWVFALSFPCVWFSSNSLQVLYFLCNCPFPLMTFSAAPLFTLINVIIPHLYIFSLLPNFLNFALVFCSYHTFSHHVLSFLGKIPLLLTD